MTKRLLNKTTSSFLALAVIILLVSAPVFYFICQWLYIYETDEVLLFHKGAFVKHSSHFTGKDIAAWNKYNRDVKIINDIGVTKDSIAGKMLYDSIAGENEPFRILYALVEINGKKFTYIEKNNLVEMEGMVYSIAIMFFFIILILLGGIIMLLKYSADRLWSPFYDTLSQIHDFEIDKNNPPNFIPTDINEFNRLNKSLEKLIEKNTAIFKSQKEFIENAAHELQTPLALFQTKIELLAQLPAISKEESQLISSLNNDVARMNRLNKNLLLLSKIDNNTYTEQQEVVLNDYIEKNFEFFVEQAKSKQIVITTNLKDKVAINTNPILVEVLINNLFLNAIRHNVQDGTITITTYNNNSIIFTNTASAGALNVNKLFNRFSKSNPSSQGNGLGLAIVKKIAEISNWEISYSYNRPDNLHFFTVNFNAKR